jgi:thiol-disulfide isomerase/thioredoxin
MFYLLGVASAVLLAPKAPAAVSVCNLKDAPASLIDADVKKLASTKDPDSALQRLEAAQLKMEEAATAYKAAEAEMGAALEEMLETPAVNHASLVEEMNKKEADLLVVFYAPWCGHCQHFVLHDGSGDPRKAPLEKINKELTSDTLKVLRYDITQGEGPADMPVEFIPTVYLAKKDGSKHMFQGDPSAPDALKNFVASQQ